MLDLGTYPLSLFTKLMGVPTRMAGLKQMDQSGVHGQVSLVMENMSGNQATLATTLYGLTPTNAAIVGTLGTVQFGSEFNLPGPFRILSADGSIVLDCNEPRGRISKGCSMRPPKWPVASRRGKTQTDCRPLPQTLNMLEALDKIVETLSIDYSASV